MIDIELKQCVDKCAGIIPFECFAAINKANNGDLSIELCSETLNRIDKFLKEYNSEDNLEWVISVYPTLGKCLSNLRAHPIVIQNDSLLRLVLKCVFWFYQKQAVTQSQIRINQWVREQISPNISSYWDVDKMKKLLKMKLDNMSFSDRSLEFWMRSFLNLDLIDDRNIKRRIVENLLKVVKNSQAENMSLEILKNIWEKSRTDDLLLSPTMKQTLWLLYSPGLESDVISLIETEEDDSYYDFMINCESNPELVKRVFSILFSIFRSTNYHPKPLEVAIHLISNTDPQLLSQLHPLIWLLSMDPKKFPCHEFVWKTISQLISSGNYLKDELTFIISLFPHWLHLLLRNISKPEVLSLCTRLIHSSNCCQYLTNCVHPAHALSLAQCHKCISLSLASISSRLEMSSVASCLQSIDPSVNLDVLLDWWQQE